MARGLGAPGPPASGAGGACATAYALSMPNGRARSDPRYYLTAAPLERVEIPTLFEEGGVVEVLEEPPTLRPPTLGWDLWTLDTARHVAGKKAFVENGYRKRLVLFTGGTLTFVASCIEFLGWPRKPYHFLRDPGLNGVGLTELSGGGRVYLEREQQIAPAGSHDFPPRTVEWGDDFAERAAYQLVLQTHEWFGVEAGAVPFVDHERRVLDAAALEAHLKGSNVAALAAP